MKKWLGAFAVALVFALSVVFTRGDSTKMLTDSDTSVLLTAIRARQNPLSWFVGDWPLANHFYRPVSTLSFELDNRLYGNLAWGYGLTNALLAGACILLLFWLVRELTDRPLVSASAAVLFGFWLLKDNWLLILSGWTLVLVPLVIGIWRHRLAVRYYAAAPFLVLFLLDELWGKTLLHYRIVNWLPGRTASVMTVFALISLASYARYLRLTSQTRRVEAPGPLTPPATRNTVATKKSKYPIIWMGAAVVCLILALGSYEQAVMLPSVLGVVGASFFFRNRSVDWRWHGLFWAVLVAYVALRYQVVPSDTSRYQRQQLRFGPGVWLDFTDYLCPALGTYATLQGAIDGGLAVFFTSTPLYLGLLYGQNLTAFYQARRHWVLPAFGYVASCLAYLPMAFLKPFDHYHLWPMAMRSIMVVSFGPILGRALLSAWSRPAQQAPPRPTPAPGSLPRP